MAQASLDSGLQWVTLFDNMNAQTGTDGKIEKPKKSKAAGKNKDVVKESKNKDAVKESENMEDVHLPDCAETGAKGGKKRLSIERIYQKKSQLEHILLRPDTYIGSVEKLTQSMWVFDEDQGLMVQRELTFVPGLYKIFDEILVNAADNKQRDPNMTMIKIDIDPESSKIKIWNNGKGIPVVEHKTEKMYVPTMIFGHLLTSSNYDDTEKKVTGGRNGYGAKLCNIFSTKFIVETSSKDFKKSFKQTWIDNMGKTKEPNIGESKSEDFTSITFHPDLEKFKMDNLDKDTVDLFTRRAYDIAAATKGVRVILNGKKLPIKNFQDYVNLYIKDKVDDNGAPLKVVYDNPSPRWEVAVTISEKGFQQVSFVNSIATTKGGRHVDNVTDQVVSKLIDIVKKKNKGGVQIKPFQVKNHMWIFVNCLIENPTFDSQTKENMTLQAKSFGSRCSLSEKFITQASKCGIVESILSWMKFKQQAQLNKKLTSSKHSKLKGIPKLDDANDAGTRNSKDCTLILTEGDSAKTLAVAGLGVVGRDHFGVFPLRGKVLNVREATHKQIMENAEINNIIKIMGLQFKEKYEDQDSLKNLRYGKMMIMTDQDQDGSHIKGLLINFMHHFWPNLLKHNIIQEFITPIVKVSKSNVEKSFYSLPEFEEWKRETENWHTWKVKYYKGLGTSTSKEAKEYFTDMDRHKIPFKYVGTEDDACINLAFSKKKIEERKEWLTNWMDERKRRAELGLPESYLYGKDTNRISYNDFINKELILFSNMDNTRSIPSLVDGFKPGQRKVMFACFKRNLNRELKVAQLAGSVAEQSAYHHGEQSLMGTIINLAQNFVGSNNLNVLLPIGQFGTRIHGGKDAASPRYIFTQLSPLARMLYNQFDDALLKSNYDDNQKIEPEWYIPIIPMVLVNGAEGIGTGWSTKIPNYNIREIVANIRRILDGLDPLTMHPSYKNFKGTVDELSDNKYVVNGEVSIIDDQNIEITELPIRTWTQNYKEEVLEPMLYGTEKTPATILDYKEYHTDTTVKFTVKMAAEKLAQAEETGLHKVFKLQSTISTSSMVLFDHNGCIKRYNSVEEIMQEFFDLRLTYYQKRKDYMEGLLQAEADKLDNIARFIMEKIAGEITIENKPKKELITMLVRRGYDSDPMKKWKELQAKSGDSLSDDESDDAASDVSGSSGPDFNYILGMPLWSLTKEKKEELLKQRDNKKAELEDLRKKTKEDLWVIDLDTFMEKLDEVEQQEKEDELAAYKKPVKLKGKIKPRKAAIEETKPSPMGRRVEPRVDTAMKNKARQDAAKKAKDKIKKEQKNLLDMFNKDDSDVEIEPKSLADRINAKPVKEKMANDVKEKKEKKPRSPRVKQNSGSPSKKKGGKKRSSWSDDSEESGGDISSDNDMEGSFLEDVLPRDRAVPRRAAAQKTNYKIGSDDEEQNSGVESNEDDFKPTEAAGGGDHVSKPADISDISDAVMSGDNVDSDNDEDFFAKMKPKKKEKKPAAPKPKAAPVSKPPEPAVTMEFSDDEEDIGKQNSFSDPFKSSSTSDVPLTIDSDKEDLFKPVEPIKKKTAAPKAPPKKRATGEKKADPKQPSIASALSKVPAKPKTKPSKAVLMDSSSEPENDVIPVSSSVVSAKEKPPKEKKPRKPKKAKKGSDSDLSDIDDKPKKKQVKKRAAKPFGDDSDFSEDSYVPKKKKATTAAKKKSLDSEDDEFNPEDVSDFAPRARAGRAKAPVKYNFDDDEDSDF